MPQKIKTITIIGSKGEMGKIFKSSFQKQGLKVIEIEQKTPFPKWESLLADSQMIIVSVPIEKTPAVVQKILPYLKPHQILSDFTSVKKELFVLFKKTQSAVISAHPMFGKIEKIQAQKILLLPIKEKVLHWKFSTMLLEETPRKNKTSNRKFSGEISRYLFFDS